MWLKPLQFCDQRHASVHRAQMLFSFKNEISHTLHFFNYILLIYLSLYIMVGFAVYCSFYLFYHLIYKCCLLPSNVALFSFKMNEYFLSWLTLNEVQDCRYLEIVFMWRNFTKIILIIGIKSFKNWIYTDNKAY